MDLELSAHGGGITRTQENGTLAPPGQVVGLTSLLRVIEPIALGVLAEYAQLEWSATALGGPPAASVDRLLLAGAMRWYPLRNELVLPYVQLALGHPFHSSLPESAGCRVALGLGAQLAAGMDLPLASWARIGGSVTAFGAVYRRSCIETGGAQRRPVDPGLGFATQAVFTAVWSPAP